VPWSLLFFLSLFFLLPLTPSLTTYIDYLYPQRR
jgi:hypothetical protein